MDIPLIDLSKPENLLKEIFDDDRWVKDKFSNYLAADALHLSESLAVCFDRFPRLNSLGERGLQAALVVGFMHCVLDDLVVSAKLLMTGKLMASGNLMRQAIEGVCIAVMCASDKPLKIGKDELVYWQLIEANDRRAYAHKAMGQVRGNWEKLGIVEDALEKLQRSHTHYNATSHPGLVGIAYRMSLGEVGQVFIGGAFDDAKLDAYRIEIRERIGLSGILPGVFDNLYARLQAGVQSAPATNAG